ncbi:hypothetical protein J569_1161 [Acinetobacter sp. 907131]|nr:hypothetical protein J569_1161 [Acinetobacter sp. 907131]EXS16871.1 hypothetical protein J672_1602 [Acinetobacter sp. 883425]
MKQYVFIYLIGFLDLIIIYFKSKKSQPELIQRRSANWLN